MFDLGFWMGCLLLKMYLILGRSMGFYTSSLSLEVSAINRFQMLPSYRLLGSRLSALHLAPNLPLKNAQLSCSVYVARCRL